MISRPRFPVRVASCGQGRCLPGRLTKAWSLLAFCALAPQPGRSGLFEAVGENFWRWWRIDRVRQRRAAAAVMAAGVGERCADIACAAAGEAEVAGELDGEGVDNSGRAVAADLIGGGHGLVHHRSTRRQRNQGGEAGAVVGVLRRRIGRTIFRNPSRTGRSFRGRSIRRSGFGARWTHCWYRLA